VKNKKIGSAAAVTALALGAALAAAGPASAATAPNIKEGACSAGTTWVQVDSQAHGWQCYGFQGETAVDEWVYVVDTGNNCGSIEDSAGQWTAFLAGGQANPTGGKKTFFVAAISISGWVGDGKNDCTYVNG
jgi:hypothetical protein